jgi:magnesium chelatase family protein
VTRPPFIAPHHTASFASIVGGGVGLAAPGAVSLAHRGVLFMDEAPEFDTRVLESLRQPLESGEVTIARSLGIVSYPARFQLVLAANPCGCAGGGDGRSGRTCECSGDKLRRYKARLSGPFRDRLDIVVELDAVSPAVLDDDHRGEPSAVVRERVLVARAAARERLQGTPWQTMAEVPGPVVRRRWRLPASLLQPIRRDVDRGTLSTRGIDRILKVAWTLADLAGRSSPGPDEIDEALLLRHGTRVVRSLATPA